MTLSPATYFATWGIIVSAWLFLGYKYYTKWNNHLKSLGNDIRSYNASQGYGQSVGREQLAHNFRTPFQDSHLRSYAEANGVSVRDYTENLKDTLGAPYPLFTTIVLHVLGVLYALSGVSYLTQGGFLSPITYLASLFGLFAISFILYWLL